MMATLRKDCADGGTDQQASGSSSDTLCGDGTASDSSVDAEVEPPPAKIRRVPKVRGLWPLTQIVESHCVNWLGPLQSVWGPY